MEYKTNRHSVYRLTYHAVFVVKYRRKVLDGDMIIYLRNLVAYLIERCGGNLIEFNGEPDHVHILFELPPNMAPSKVICSLKTQTSKGIRANFGDRLKNKLWKNAFWSSSYFLTTTGGASIEVLEQYIRSQNSPK